MVQSPSWAANWVAASQEIPRISRNPKVHYRTHKRSFAQFWSEERTPIFKISPLHSEARVDKSDSGFRWDVVARAVSNSGL